MSANESTPQMVEESDAANNPMQRENKDEMVAVAEDHCNKGNKCFTC